jgi:hypothetical protein
MLFWARGQFELWQAEVDGRDEVRTSTTFLLMEGMRRMDESAANDDVTPKRGPHAPAAPGVGGRLDKNVGVARRPVRQVDLQEAAEADDARHDGGADAELGNSLF